MNTLGAIYGFHRVAQILLVLLLHGWSSWGGDAVEFGPWPGHRGDVGEPHGRLLASFTVANVTTADEFVAAFVDPAVKLIRLTSSVVDVPISAWDPYRPVILTRNLSVEGCTTVTADWPTLQMNRAVAVITMSNGVFLSFRNMLMDGVLSRNPTPDQGFTMMAPTPPGPPAAIYFGPGAFILRERPVGRGPVDLASSQRCDLLANVAPLSVRILDVPQRRYACSRCGDWRRRS
ncbi:hypothetical protein Vretimale_7405 [Volvox reticuliferus]|uniref:Uncharacterized protein n=1 Tax=Volvox reticuliferus TaxID=1737510 RepID=A0A8J4FJS8_9CHLO|nr:hypothetical protein Vretifemale_7495 [Volvox reticuliferus]GIM02565.1 hypothetical protein Vretimale_7405 [Volvox reticuliferus]